MTRTALYLVLSCLLVAGLAGCSNSTAADDARARDLRSVDRSPDWPRPPDVARWDLPVWPDRGGDGPRTGDRRADKLVVPDAAPVYVSIPLSCGAGYPFSDECYAIHVQSALVEDYAGKIDTIWYGFSKASLADYLANNNVPWFNAAGQPTHEGTVKVAYKHDGGYKGSYVIDPPLPKVAVPPGMNFVFAFTYDVYGGDCLTDNDTVWLSKPKSKTYFVKLVP